MLEFILQNLPFIAVGFVIGLVGAYACGLAWSRGYHRGKREFVIGMINDCTKEGTKRDGEN